MSDGEAGCMNWRAIFSFAILAAFAALSCAVCGNEKPENVPDKIDFNRDIRPLLSASCFPCHGPDKTARKAKLRLDRRDDALADHDGDRAIMPGKPDKSEMIARVSSDDPEKRMPPGKNEHKL